MARIVLCVIFVLAAIYFMLPVFSGIFHIGMIYPALILTLAAAMLAFPNETAQIFTGRFHIIAAAAAILLGVFLTSVFGTLIAMGISAANRPANDEPATVVVLGCQVNGTEPSVMLSSRIATAYDYLSKNERSVCIASGGRGDNEQISEAECIKRELVQLGIDENRIILEDKSQNTAENLSNSAKIIKEKGLPQNIAVASDNFHQLRAKIYAKRQGLSAYSLGCRTFWAVCPGYWTREVPAVYKALFLD